MYATLSSLARLEVLGSSALAVELGTIAAVTLLVWLLLAARS